MDALKVHIDVNDGSISVWNNGQGIPISMHKEYQVYVPELIFGHLLTGRFVKNMIILLCLKKVYDRLIG